MSHHRRDAREGDNLAYDCELGWIDPEDVMGSLGIECREVGEYLYYLGVDRREFRVPKSADWARLRLCLEDAEQRAKAREA